MTLPAPAIIHSSANVPDNTETNASESASVIPEENDLSEASASPSAEVEPVEDSKKRKTRLEQNRISARESRKRKKMMIEELQRSVAVLSNENRLLNQQNQILRHQLVTLVPGASLLGLPGMQMAPQQAPGISAADVPGLSDVAALQNLWQATNSAANLTAAATNAQNAQVVNIPPAPATAKNGSDL